MKTPRYTTSQDNVLLASSQPSNDNDFVGIDLLDCCDRAFSIVRLFTRLAFIAAMIAVFLAACAGIR